jgi:hypothetical protein
MPAIPSTLRAGEPKLAKKRARAVHPEAIDDPWKDEIVHRLFRALERQLSRLENAERKHGSGRANSCAANVRTLAAIERTLERLLQVEVQRAAIRETRATVDDDDALAELERRLDRLLAAVKEEYPVPEPGK